MKMDATTVSQKILEKFPVLEGTITADGTPTFRGLSVLGAVIATYFGPEITAYTLPVMGFCAAAANIVQRLRAKNPSQFKPDNATRNAIISEFPEISLLRDGPSFEKTVEDFAKDSLRARAQNNIRWSTHFACITLTTGLLTLATLKGGTAFQTDAIREELNAKEMKAIASFFDPSLLTQSAEIFQAERTILSKDSWRLVSMKGDCTLVKKAQNGNCVTADRQITINIPSQAGKNKTAEFTAASSGLVEYCKVPEYTNGSSSFTIIRVNHGNQLKND